MDSSKLNRHTNKCTHLALFLAATRGGLACLNMGFAGRGAHVAHINKTKKDIIPPASSVLTASLYHQRSHSASSFSLSLSLTACQDTSTPPTLYLFLQDNVRGGALYVPPYQSFTQKTGGSAVNSRLNTSVHIFSF